jgi:peroxiredoxin Q/BCP
MSVAVGESIPDAEIPATGGDPIRLSDLQGQILVLFFYPKASTPGCTQEGQDFRDAYGGFRDAGVEVLGASRDSLKSQENFKAKHGFPFRLLSDTDETLCALFDVIKMKKMYGREVRGIERSTFLVDEAGVLRREWRGVKVKGHVQQVMEAVKELQTTP